MSPPCGGSKIRTNPIHGFAPVATIYRPLRGLRERLAEVAGAIAEGSGYSGSGISIDMISSSSRRCQPQDSQKVCPAADISREFGYEKPCFLVCDPDGPAIAEAFPDLKADTLCRQANGDCVCIFQFERKR